MEKKYVYVIVEEGSWDYEFTNSLEVYDNFQKAKKDFEQRVKDTKTDMADWLEEDETEIDETNDLENEHLYFSMYENGYYTRLHNSISLNKMEVK